ncbi:MAG: hypothetical protein QOJ26_838 [Thermoplasmata archaeon]|nr:hypothetical protein [Thermoplasmata archaeon]
MRSAATASLLVLTALLAAGCLGSGGGGGDPVPSSGPPGTSSPSSPTLSPPPPQSLVVDLLPDFAFEPCLGVSVQATRPADQVQALLPEGFTPAPAFGSDGFAVIGVDLYACGNLTTPNARIANVAFGQVYAQVLRPADRVPGAPEATVHEYAFRLLAGDDVLARLWPSAGYDTRNGTATVTVDPLGNGLPADPGLRLGDGAVADYHLIGSGGPPGTPFPASTSFARYTALSDGSVLVWTGTYSFPAGFSGQGSFSVPADDPFAGFQQANQVPGVARMFETGGILDQDLRRFF